MSRIVLASNNSKKVQELQLILNPLKYDIIPQAQLNIDEAVEDGLSFVENALIKARHASKASGLPAIADDSGIEVDRLKGAPGIYSARYAGEDATDESNNDKLLDALAGVPIHERTARYQCLIVFLRHENDPTPLICSGTWEGRILTEPQGNGGFGYDPLFYSSAFNKSAASLTNEEKQSVSHRGKALRQLMHHFQQIFS